MKNLLTYTLFISVSLNAFALSQEEKAIQEKENMKILAEMGLPLPGSGIKLVPRTLLGLTSEELLLAEREIKEYKERGYINRDLTRVRELLSINHQLVLKELNKRAAIKSETYTGLSSDITKIKLAFNFPVLDKSRHLKLVKNDIEMLGAAPKGGFHDELGGWSGASQYFTYKGIGTCSYSVMNVLASHTAALLAQEDVTYTINNKATIIIPVEGSYNSGFLYYIKWYDLNNFHELECASHELSKKIEQDVIKLAKKIDLI